MPWLVMPAVGSCQSCSPTRPASAGPIAIKHPVGQGGLAWNRADDVRIIQEALNQVTVRGRPGGAMPFLKVDGICGPKTRAAITKFQQAEFGSADGVIEPNKRSIVRLNEIIEPVSTADLQVKVRLALPLVIRSLAAAIANLQAIIASGPAATGPAATAADRLNRHFRIGTLSASEQSTARVDLFRTYSRLLTVISRPELFDIDALDEFDLDMQNPKIALTNPGGFFETGKEEQGRRLDHIHLGLGFFAPAVTPDFASMIIIHELAHFVGDANGEHIADHGRGWFDDTFIKPLGAAQRLLNADSYASFAHECGTGSAAKPPFVRTAPGGLGGAR